LFDANEFCVHFDPLGSGFDLFWWGLSLLRSNSIRSQVVHALEVVALTSTSWLVRHPHIHDLNMHRRSVHDIT
jgi:hypothetical protein